MNNNISITTIHDYDNEVQKIEFNITNVAIIQFSKKQFKNISKMLFTPLNNSGVYILKSEDKTEKNESILVKQKEDFLKESMMFLIIEISRKIFIQFCIFIQLYQVNPLTLMI